MEATPISSPQRSKTWATSSLFAEKSPNYLDFCSLIRNFAAKYQGIYGN
jgi:hypothetical protein